MLVDGPEDVRIFSTAAALSPVWLFRRDRDESYVGIWVMTV